MSSFPEINGEGEAVTSVPTINIIQETPDAMKPIHGEMIPIKVENNNEVTELETKSKATVDESSTETVEGEKQKENSEGEEKKESSDTSELEVTKYSLRKQIWTTFDNNGVVAFPRPCRGRIPNFRGAQDAAEKLKSTEIFQNAKVIKVNPDKPQEGFRVFVLQEKKQLVVSPRRSETVALYDVKLPEELTPQIIQTAATRFGMRNYGQPLAVDSGVKIDLLVIGSVAVSRTGQRIGKCDGYSDLEFAFLTEIGAITKDTVIATTVHDSQVFDTLPEHLFREHDIPVDLIVTPTEVIQVPETTKRPSGVIWPILSKRRLALYPNIAALHQKRIESGQECHLKEEDTDEETERDIRRKHRPYQFFKFPYRRNHKKSESKKEGEGNDETSKTETEKKTEKKRRRPRKSQNSSSNSEKKTDSEEDGKKTDRKRRFNNRRYFRRTRILFSVRIGNIVSTDRVRDLKNALAARNVRPADISWFGRRGFAFVHFAKLKKEPVLELDTVVETLKDMKLGELKEGEEKAPVVVQPAGDLPSRVETTAVTAV